MLPGPILYYSCPKCYAVTSEATMRSGNTFGARGWTDGKLLAPMFEEFTDIIKCMNCRSFFWIDDAELKGKFDIMSEEEDQPIKVEDWMRTAHVARELTREEYIEAVNGNIANTREREIYLRVRLWWSYNDQARKLPYLNTDLHNDYVYVDNLSKLERILDEKKLDENILKAEANRELGNFDRAIDLLENISSELRVHKIAYHDDPEGQLEEDELDSLAETADLILRLAKDNKVSVQEIL